MTGYEAAIEADEADRAFECLCAFDSAVLAVSGGPDSLALLTLAAEWAQRKKSNIPTLSVATVDHGLRASSAHEARIVAGMAASFGLRHATLIWSGQKPDSGIPNAARNARYALLDKHAQALAGGGRAALVTAHHQDDQAETLLMRLARGGGVSALAAMARDRRLSLDTTVRLVRPILDFPKSRLMATLARRGLHWIDDPTNSDTTYERSRVRAALVASGLQPAPLAVTARRMRDAAEGLEFAATAFEISIDLKVDRAIYARFERAPFDTGPAVLRQMVLSRLIGFFGGATPAPTLAELEKLADRYRMGEPFAVTLGGAMISAGSRYVRVWREAGRIDPTPTSLHRGERVLWDDRFWVGHDSDGAVSIEVGPLGKSGYETFAADIKHDSDWPAGALAGLPAFFVAGEIFAVPILGGARCLKGEFEGLGLLCEPNRVDCAN